MLYYLVKTGASVVSVLRLLLLLLPPMCGIPGRRGAVMMRANVVVVRLIVFYRRTVLFLRGGGVGWGAAATATAVFRRRRSAPRVFGQSPSFLRSTAFSSSATAATGRSMLMRSIVALMVGIVIISRGEVLVMAIVAVGRIIAVVRIPVRRRPVHLLPMNVVLKSSTETEKGKY